MLVLIVSILEKADCTKPYIEKEREKKKKKNKQNKTKQKNMEKYFQDASSGSTSILIKIVLSLI